MDLEIQFSILTVDLPEIQEVNTMAIAKDKALLAAQLAQGPCVVEDTSLEFSALGGMPGPYVRIVCVWSPSIVAVESISVLTPNA
jgi:inosine/xanthosine triphosphate pyrophosphatase family protein